MIRRWGRDDMIRGGRIGEMIRGGEGMGATQDRAPKKLYGY